MAGIHGSKRACSAAGELPCLYMLTLSVAWTRIEYGQDSALYYASDAVLLLVVVELSLCAMGDAPWQPAAVLMQASFLYIRMHMYLCAE